MISSIIAIASTEDARGRERCRFLDWHVSGRWLEFSAKKKDSRVGDHDYYSVGQPEQANVAAQMVVCSCGTIFLSIPLATLLNPSRILFFSHTPTRMRQ